MDQTDQPLSIVQSGASGKWMYRCVFSSSVSNTPPRFCVIEQRLFINGENKKPIYVGSVILARATDEPVKRPLSDRPWRLTVSSPPGISLHQGLRLIIDNDPPLNLPWQTCITTECLAMQEFPDGAVKTFFRGRKGRIEVGKLQGGIIAFNFSFEGADAALSAVENLIIHYKTK